MRQLQITKLLEAAATRFSSRNQTSADRLSFGKWKAPYLQVCEIISRIEGVRNALRVALCNGYSEDPWATERLSYGGIFGVSIGRSSFSSPYVLSLIIPFSFPTRVLNQVGLVLIMDGLSALSVASSVAQLVDFACSVVSKTKEIYKSKHGASVGHFELGIATKRLLELSGRVKNSLQEQGTGDDAHAADAALEIICNSCIALSEELLARLEKVKIPEGQRYRKFKSLRQALKSIWPKDAIHDIAQRLDSYRSELDDHLLASMW